MAFFAQFVVRSCILGTLCTPCYASEDESVRRALRQQAVAAVADRGGRPMDPYFQRWRWAYRCAGLIPPPVHDYYDAWIHRMDRDPAFYPSHARLRIQHGRDPVETLRAISNFWGDVEGGNVELNGLHWRLHKGDDSVVSSYILPVSATHFLLHTGVEDRLHPGEVTTFMEILWQGFGQRDAGLTQPWLPQKTTALRILSRAGILVACTTTHRCTLWINGWEHTSPEVTLAHGAYVRVCADPIAPPVSQDEEISPMPIAASVAPLSSSSSTSSEGLSLDADASDTSLQASADEYTEMILIFRPVGLAPRPRHAHALVVPGTSSWRAAVYEAWPSLRFLAWMFADVDASFYDDFLQTDDVVYKVLIHMADLPSPLHQVGFVAVNWKAFTMFQAFALPPLAHPANLLDTIGLHPWCSVAPDACTVSHNGDEWLPHHRRALHHGDYFFVRISDQVPPTIEAYLAMLFYSDEELHGWHLLDALGHARIAGNGADAISMLPGNFPVPHGGNTFGVSADSYWITIGFLVWFSGFALLVQLCPLADLCPASMICHKCLE